MSKVLSFEDVMKKRPNVKTKGYTPNVLSIFEKSQILYETSKITQQTVNQSANVNKYGGEHSLL